MKIGSLCQRFVLIFLIIIPSSVFTKKRAIIHVTTEFASALAGGLGSVVNDIAFEQAKRGDDVTVILPYFKTHEGKPAYSFLQDTSKIQEIEFEWNHKTLRAKIHTIDFHFPTDHNVRVNLKAIEPIGEYTHLTVIKNTNNPYLMTDSSIEKSIRSWDAIKGTPTVDEIIATFTQFRNIEKSIQSEMEKIDSSDRSQQGQPALELKEKIDELLKTKQQLLTQHLFGGYTLQSADWRVSNEKAYVLSLITGYFLYRNETERSRKGKPTDIIQFHHFGNDAQVFKDYLSANGITNRPAIVKTLHGINVKLTNLDGRENPIVVGIKAADAIHVVSQGSYKELENDIQSKKFEFPESRAVNLEHVFVAANGIDIEKLSFETIWNKLKAKFDQNDINYPIVNLSKLSCREKKYTFKKMLKILADSKIADHLVSKDWISHYDPQKPMMIFVGRFSPVKGYTRLTVAAEEARRFHWNFAILGYGDTGFELELKKKYPEVILLNNLGDQEIAGGLIRGGADITLLTSNNETAGLVLLEGQVMGNSVTTSNIPGPVSLCNPHTCSMFNIIYLKGKKKINERTTRANLRRILDSRFKEFNKTTNESLEEKCEENISFALNFSRHKMLTDIDHIYAEAKKFKELQINGSP